MYVNRISGLSFAFCHDLLPRLLVPKLMTDDHIQSWYLDQGYTFRDDLSLDMLACAHADEWSHMQSYVLDIQCTFCEAALLDMIARAQVNDGHMKLIFLTNGELPVRTCCLNH